MEETLTLVAQAKAQAESILKNELPKQCVYHNYEHTARVVEAAKLIGKESDLNKEELEIVELAAWFHDVGYRAGCQNHEKNGAKIVREFLTAQGYPEVSIEKVEGCILATQMPQKPTNLLEEVLCDADLCHLGCTDYFNMAALMRNEFENVKGEKIDPFHWNQMNIDFFKGHQYFTAYGKKVLQPMKEENLKKIKKEGKSLKKQEKYIQDLETQVEKLSKKVALKPDRGIETMFRVTSKNHLQLSAMADNKANIMISVNTIIISVVVSVLIRKFDEFPNLVVPTLILIAVCLTTIVLSVLATRPNVSSGTFTDEDIQKRKTNLLFFGNFHGMDLDRYDWGMKEMMKDGDFLYSSLIRDIYFLGKVLGKKYRLLRKAYTCFMIGFVISILAFMMAVLFFPSEDQSGFYTF